VLEGNAHRQASITMSFFLRRRKGALTEMPLPSFVPRPDRLVHRLVEFRAAVRVAGGVGGHGPDVDVLRADDLGPRHAMANRCALRKGT